jgi:predicted nicotinamide N-methyase
MLEEKESLVFPDVLEKWNRGDRDSEDVLVDLFFELANAKEVLYRMRNFRRDGFLRFQQDMSACEHHTGGIIWETSYLLLEYLLEQNGSNKVELGRTLELGAGVGFLGQCLLAERCCHPVLVLTEAAEVVENLNANVEANRSILEKNVDCRVSVRTLDWTQCKPDIHAAADCTQPHAFDTLLGTDIIFTTHLVEPLLQTAAYLSHSGTIWFLCVQVRCAAAHELFLTKAPVYGFSVADISNEAFSSKRCAWGKALDCFLFRITRLTSS